MKYFFNLGNNPTLSIAEITAKFPNNHYSLISDDILLLTSKSKINTKKTINELGGTIKIGKIIDFNSPINNFEKEIPTIINNTISNYIKDQKYRFGFSNHTNKKLNTKRLAMEIKRFLKEKNINSRWVTSKEKILSSVVVEQNKLITRGTEIILMEKSNKLIIGQTLAIQPFKSLSFRDFGRPARDDKSGMLPPKLAQILINLSNSNKDKVLLDPFCGSGTIITEGLLMGFKNLIGSDISKKAISDSEQNIKWTTNKYDASNINHKLINCSSLNLLNIIKPNSIDSIATEPYLGPQRGNINLNKTTKEIEELYTKSLAVFHKILKTDGTISIIFPVFNIKNKQYFVNPKLSGFTISNPIPANLTNNKSIKLTNRNTIIYSRPGQRVEREIVQLKKTFK